MQNHELLSKLAQLNIYTVDGFSEEYFELVHRKPNHRMIDKKAFELLQFVSTNRNPAVFCVHPQIEKLKECKDRDLYAIKIKIECNIRILFSIDKDGTILLHTFEEKAGKKKTGYTHAIPIAKSRLTEYKGGQK